MGSKGKDKQEKRVDLEGAALSGEGVREATQVLLWDAGRREAQAKMSPAERRKAKKAEERQAKRFYGLLPGGLKQEVKGVAAEHECSVSSCAAVLLNYAFKDIASGELDPSSYLRPIVNIKWGYELAWPGSDDEKERVNYDLSVDLLERTKSLAEELDCSRSSLVGFLLWYSLGAHKSGRFDLMKYRRPLHNPRWMYEFVWDEKVRNGQEG